MATTTVTNIGYTGTIQNANVYGVFGVPVNAYLWGAGGGSAPGRGGLPGNAGGYSKVFFVAKPGDILTVAVGQGGGRGGSNINPWTPSGFPGAAYSGLLFNTRFPPPGQDTAVYPYGQRYRSVGNGISSFLQQWGVWGADQNVQTFTRTYTINFPTTANVIFQMVASTYGRVYLDGTLIVEGAGRSNTPVYNDTINQAFVKVSAGNHTVTIQADGKGTPANPNDDNPNVIGVTFGTGDQTTFSGGQGGFYDNYYNVGQGAAGGGGGATILSLNGVIIGVAAGGAGGATRPASGVSYVTTNYAGSTATQPFSTGLVPPAPPVVIAPGTSGYYINILQAYNDVGNLIYTYYLGYSVVVNGVSVYMSQVAGGGPDAVPPPLDLAQKTTFVGNSYVGGNAGPNGQVSIVQCWNFIYTSSNVNGSTDYRYNNGQAGQNLQYVQDIYNSGSEAGGGGGGGGGLWAGQGGTAGYGAPNIAGRAGINGTSLGDETAQPVQQTPYINSFYPGGGVAEGGTSSTPADGGNGAVVLEYQTGGGGAVNDLGAWKPVQTTYVKDAGTWKPVQTTYINVNGIWKPTQGVPVPTFTQFNGAFAPLSRDFGQSLKPPPPPPAPTYDYSGSTGYGETVMF